MTSFKNNKKQSDSLYQLLKAQCSQLENYLALTREQVHAAAGGDFKKALRADSERAILEKKLEAIQEQISQSLLRCGETLELAWQTDVALRMSGIVSNVVSDNEQIQFLINVAGQNPDEKLINNKNLLQDSKVYQS